MFLLVNHSFSCPALEGHFIVFTTLGRPVTHIHKQAWLISPPQLHLASKNLFLWLLYLRLFSFHGSFNFLSAQRPRFKTLAVLSNAFLMLSEERSRNEHFIAEWVSKTASVPHLLISNTSACVRVLCVCTCMSDLLMLHFWVLYILTHIKICSSHSSP